MVKKSEAGKKQRHVRREGEKRICPDGGIFGVDIGKLNHCLSCDLWDDCIELADELEKNRIDKEKLSNKEEAKGRSCPGGGRFGYDIAKLNHCQSCDLWDDCVKKGDELQEMEMKEEKNMGLWKLKGFLGIK